MRRLYRILFAISLLIPLAPSRLLAQLSPEEALKRLHEREEFRRRAATQPAANDSPAEPKTPSAVHALQSLATDLHDVMERNAADDAGIAACFGSVKGQSYSFAGTAFGLISGTPQDQSASAILVRITLPVDESLDKLWREDFRVTECRWDDQIKSLQKAHDSIVSTTINSKRYGDQAAAANDRGDYYLGRIAGLNRSKQEELKAQRGRRPAPTMVQIYLTASPDVMASIKRNSPLRGQIKILGGSATRANWTSDKFVRAVYAGEIRLDAEYQPAPAVAAPPSSEPSKP